jgi:hypothetical protein
MRTEDFVKLLRLQRVEAPAVRPTPVTTGIIDPASFETYETPVSDSARVAAAIVAAAKLARSGPPAAKMSDVAERILAAGRKRRAEG